MDFDYRLCNGDAVPQEFIWEDVNAFQNGTWISQCVAIHDDNVWARDLHNNCEMNPIVAVFCIALK